MFDFCFCSFHATMSSLFSNPSPLPLSVQHKMLATHTYPSDSASLSHCASPIPFSHLSHFMYMHPKTHQIFEMIIHKDIYFTFKSIFNELVVEKTDKITDFVVERMELVEEFAGDDETSMLANNSSAFNVRPITGKTNMFSKHSYGLAIDINPLYNPYINGDLILPKGSDEHLAFHYATDSYEKCQLQTCYHITSHVADIFKRRGFDWGGDWKGVKQDWHHFEIVPPNYLSQITWNISMQEYDAWFQNCVQADCVSVVGGDRGSINSNRTTVISLKDGSVQRALHISARTERLIIESVTTDDCDSLSLLFSHETSMRHFSLQSHTETQSKERIADFVRDWASHNPYSGYVVRRCSDGSVVGHVRLQQQSNSDIALLECCMHDDSGDQDAYAEEIAIFMAGEFSKWIQCYYPLPKDLVRLERISCTRTVGETIGAQKAGFLFDDELQMWIKQIAITQLL